MAFETVAGKAVARETPAANASVAFETHAAWHNATQERLHFVENRQAEQKQGDLNGLAADAATQEDAQNDRAKNKAIAAPCTPNSQDEGGLLQSRELSEEDAATLLVPCAKCDAGTAHSIKEALQKKLGRDAAAALLKQYRQVVMRNCDGKNTRYWLDVAGSTVKLADPPADVAVERWQPNLALEEAYDDLSEASSIDGYESPAHKEVKEYAKARRFAKAMATEALATEGAFASPRATGAH